MSAYRAVACTLLIALLIPAAASAATSRAASAIPSSQDRIAPGITAGGVDLSNLTTGEAAFRLSRALEPHLARPVALEVRGRVFRLAMPDVAFYFDAEKTAENALLTPAPDRAGAGGAPVGTSVPLVVKHSTTGVRSFVAAVAKKVASKSRDATMKIGVRRITVRKSRPGYRLDQVATYKRINATLADGSAPRVLRQRLKQIPAKVNTNDLARQSGTIITIQKSTRTLRLFKNLKVSKRYKVAIGQPGYPTPEGRFSIQTKQVNPVWSVPNSPWAGELAGSTVQGGSAANPLKARWMGIVGGIGIHGTGDDASIGTAASHGCLRMHVRDVIDLFRRVSIGTPVLIAR